MKRETTRKYIKALENNIIEIGYCGLQHLLTYENAALYNAGVYGWNFDVYWFNNCAIVTGYRPFGNIKPEYSIIREYDEKARAILRDCNINEDERRENINNLLNEFINHVLNN